MSFLNQEIDGIFEEDELLSHRDSAAFVTESVDASPLAQEESSLQPPRSTGDVSIQEGFLPAGNPDIVTPVFGEGDFFPPNYGLENQNGSSDFPNSLGDAGCFSDFDQEEGEYEFDVSCS
jgi:hypothetical protein